MKTATYSCSAESQIDLRFAVKVGSPLLDQQMECILDLDEFGALLGVELLTLVLPLGLPGTGFQLLPSSIDPRLDVSYDADSDALYLKLADGRSREQRVVPGRLHADADGTVCLTVSR